MLVAASVGLAAGAVAYCFFVWPLVNGGGVDSPVGRAALEALAFGAAAFAAIAAGRSARSRTLSA